MENRLGPATMLGRFRAMTPDQRLDELAVLERRLAALQAEQLQLLADIAADPPSVNLPGCGDKNWVREQVACILGSSPDYAGKRLTQAAALARIPTAIEVLARGEVTFGYLRELAERTEALDDATAIAVAGRVLPRAPEQSYSNFRQSVQRAVLALAPKADDERRTENIADRRVRFRPWDIGVTAMWALLPDETAAAIEARIRALSARVDPSDERSRDQRDADALAQLILTEAEEIDVLAREQRLRPSIQVSVALSTLVGLDEQAGEIDGVGPIPAELARRLAADPTGTWRRLVTDERGRLIDYGRSTYRPPTALADHVVARDRTCRFPGCARRAACCEIDHRIAWEDGGETNAGNLQSLCLRHHHLKHETTWTSWPADDGAVDWTDSRGDSYTSQAATYPVDETVRCADEQAAEIDPDPPPV